MKRTQGASKRNGLIGTIIFHVVILMGFFLVSLTRPYSPESTYTEFEVSFAEESSVNMQHTSSISAPKILAQEMEETISIPKGDIKENTSSQIQTPSNELLDAFAKNENTRSHAQNKGGHSIDPGNDGISNGITDLAGRELLKKPILNDNSQEAGIVVVKIVVDRSGKVVRAIAGAKGSTTTSQHLNKIAEETATEAVFSPNENAPEEQIGTITFRFVLK